jgi:hypothetical protein
MVEITETRLANVRSAERLIAVARRTERHFSAEPDDARLKQMQQRVGELVQILENDRACWAKL